MAGGRKAWRQLSPAYRRRLARAGIGAREYRSGRSLRAARGHAATPERPERASRQPERYPSYRRRGGKTMQVITRAGPVEVPNLSKAERSTVASHANAVKCYLDTGDTSRLRRFDGVRVNGAELETRGDALDWWGLYTGLSFESLYPNTATVPAR